VDLVIHLWCRHCRHYFLWTVRWTVC
jgi:hypothetical protein